MVQGNTTPGSEFNYSVCCWSTPKNSWLQDIEQSAAIGAQAVSLWERKIAPGEEDAVQEALDAHNIRAGILVPDDWTLLPTPLNPSAAGKTWKDLSTRIAESMGRLARFNPVGILIGPGVSGDPENPAGPVEAVVEGLKVVADAAGEVGLRLGLEPLARRRGAALVTLTETVEAIEKSGRSNIDLLPDVWHFWPEETALGELREFADRMMGLQVNDARFNERSWCDRVQPGEERNTCTPMIATLIEAGFTGWYDYEVFSDDGRWGNAFPDSLWAKPHEEMLREGYQAFARCYENAKQMVASRATAA
jgi:sugar phosphate isomerase/epimerase